jgi:hypothetical protein
VRIFVSGRRRSPSLRRNASSRLSYPGIMIVSTARNTLVAHGESVVDRDLLAEQVSAVKSCGCGIHQEG